MYQMWFGSNSLVKKQIPSNDRWKMKTNVRRIKLSCDTDTWAILSDMIHENNPVTNTFVSLPTDMGQLNCAAYLAGIIAGILDSTRFVSDHFVDQLHVTLYMPVIIRTQRLRHI